jgi:exodeoxyribonuclease VII large subunit
VDDFNLRLLRQQQQDIARRRERIASRAAALHAASPQALLERGYAIVSHRASGQRVRSAGVVKPGEHLTVRLHDGQINTQVQEDGHGEQYQ